MSSRKHENFCLQPVSSEKGKLCDMIEMLKSQKKGKLAGRLPAFSHLAIYRWKVSHFTSGLEKVANPLPKGVSFSRTLHARILGYRKTFPKFNSSSLSSSLERPTECKQQCRLPNPREFPPVKTAKSSIQTVERKKLSCLRDNIATSILRVGVSVKDTEEKCDRHLSLFSPSPPPLSASSGKEEEESEFQKEDRGPENR